MIELSSQNEGFMIQVCVHGLLNIDLIVLRRQSQQYNTNCRVDR